MNKEQMVAVVAKELKSSKLAAERTVNCVLGVIARNVGKGVKLVGFGTFYSVKRAAKTGRDPRNGNPIRIKAHTVVKFRPGKSLGG